MASMLACGPCSAKTARAALMTISSLRKASRRGARRVFEAFVRGVIAIECTKAESIFRIVLW
ncbi:hypothetical protein GCM10022380_01230 [Amycolatopsis tucumanensis]|uniref:Uncharacterized protein n=1 Tax=Amycolatopsis tucumanensis TaxID=401106 RepID=A0ABP7HH21_9PSEU